MQWNQKKQYVLFCLKTFVMRISVMQGNEWINVKLRLETLFSIENRDYYER